VCDARGRFGRRLDRARAEGELSMGTSGSPERTLHGLDPGVPEGGPPATDDPGHGFKTRGDHRREARALSRSGRS
jgi:hypothetical protein